MGISSHVSTLENEVLTAKFTLSVSDEVETNTAYYEVRGRVSTPFVGVLIQCGHDTKYVNLYS